LPASLAEGMARVIASIRSEAIRKPPSVSESIDWARTLLALGVDELDDGTVADTLHVLLKYQTDVDKVAASLASD
jgi:MoxR-like ATPase